MRAVIVAIAVGCLLGCSNKANNAKGKILEKDKMQAVMWDIISADVFTEQFVKRDSTKNPQVENVQLQNKIFALHKISRADYYKSYEYYIAQTNVMRELLDTMTNRAERQRSKMIELHSGAQRR